MKNYNGVLSSLKFTTALAVICFGVTSFSAISSAQLNNADLQVTAIHENSFMHDVAFAQAIQAGKIGKNRLSDTKAMKTFYASRSGEMFWLDRDMDLKSNVDAMYKKIEEAWTQGLNPYSYHYYEIHTRLGKKDTRSLIELELLLTDAYFRYAKDMSGMRIKASSIGLDGSHWKQPYTSEGVVNMLQYASQRDFSDHLNSFEPKGKTYQTLRKELINLVNKGPDAKEQMLPIQVGGLLKPGWDHKTIPQIREYFGLPHPQYATKYDDELASAVMRLQRDNGLNADAVIGPRTMEVINRTTQNKIEQIVANMERLRWVDVGSRGGKFVLVNLPSAKLWAIEGGNVQFEMPVIVGRPGRDTQSFVTEITGVRLNPDWTVPPTIKRYDILPKAQEGAEYIVNKGLNLYQGYGRDAVSIDPYSVDWNNISKGELHGIRMVQSPGDNNPLGRYRILMPNAYNIYLHDTNHPELFNDADRAQSSGCVRMKDPARMAKFLLDDVDNWSDSRTEKILASYKKTDIRIPNKVPVYILYYTTWIDENGGVIYGNDIYKQDQKLITELQKIDGFQIPVHNSDSRHNSNAHLVSYQQ